MGLDCWDKMRVPLRNLWIDVATRLGVRNRGLLKLRQDVRRCEYDDVHVMWNMLKKNETEAAALSPKRRKKRSFWSFFDWARCAPNLRH
ncbi:uncharacterized protein LOC116215154 [Punica granatum]|uniref:Uncharacterized protein n=2 Tax=Punica granatum TaxID=22663 RepID=A0A218WD46_PUNGR|nr:uncharacterized protein LOC116215154 [Punica granatum]OWM70797.1 hypothetical protein CDL15_Pgr014470 [Punica granatum]PKI31246.1 hypothetical protein CRG98_048364 [Punica granatum]